MLCSLYGIITVLYHRPLRPSWRQHHESYLKFGGRSAHILWFNFSCSIWEVVGGDNSFPPFGYTLFLNLKHSHLFFHLNLASFLYRNFLKIHICHFGFSLDKWRELEGERAALPVGMMDADLSPRAILLSYLLPIFRNISSLAFSHSACTAE